MIRLTDVATVPDPTTVTTWPQAVTYCVLAILVLGLPSVLTYLGNQRIKAVEKTLTTNNGGSHVKDSLDRIEEGHAELLASQASISTAVGELQGDVANLKAGAAKHHPAESGPPIDTSDTPPF